MTRMLDWARVSVLFHEALDVSPDARLSFVRQRTDDDVIYREVASLLETYPVAEGFLSTPAFSSASRTVPLQPGDRLGHFEIQGCVGAGGMGEVYRARDLRLGRDVALKVLSCRFDNDEEGRRRLEREARAIAALNHPRISTLHDVSSAPIGGVETTYLVMELLDGETLAARLRRGALPLGQALTVASEIAEALVAAHAAGIVHRDLKPANVMLTRSGAKLLDFGLASPRLPLIADDATRTSEEDDAQPTRALVGTLPYMAPEQLNGAGADVRSDLFAFGAVLYEMIAGRRPFEGESDVALITAIVEGEPVPLAARVPAVAPALDRLVVTCLAKDPDERWQTARDLLRELRWLTTDGVAGKVAATPARGVMRWGIATAAIVVVALLGFTQMRPTRTPTDATRVSFPIFPPAGATFPRGTAEMALSPDGTRLVFVALLPNGTRKLWVRRFDAVDSRALEGSEEASYPFWSPDGTSIGFFAHSKLKRIAEEGGVPQEICDLRAGARGGTWNREGTILFASGGQGLYRVSDTGGVPTPATELNLSRQDRTHAWPVFLEDGRRFLYLAQSNDPSQTALFQGSLGSMAVERVAASESGAAIAGSSLVVLNRGLLTAHDYDAAAAQMHHARATIAEGILSDPLLRSGAPFTATAGVIVYRSASPDSRLIWRDRTGRELGAIEGPPGDYHHPALSPDEKLVAVEKTDPSTGRHTIWILDPARGTSARLLLDPSGAHGPGWTADGRRVVFSSNRHGGIDLYIIDAAGTGPPELLLRSREQVGLRFNHWSHDGRLLYQVNHSGQADIAILTTPELRSELLLDSAASEQQAQFSPDYKWVAFTSNESGAHEVYVRRLAAGGARRQVSTRGGGQARWRGDGRELFYLAPDGRLMAADVVATADAIETGSPHALFTTGITGSFVERFNQYVVTRDGQRFLINLSAEDQNSAPLTVVINWAVKPTS